MGRRKRRHELLVAEAEAEPVRDRHKPVKQQKLHAHEASESVEGAAESYTREERPEKQDGPLSDEQLETFMRDGFVLLKNAFSTETASKARELIWKRLAHDGILEQDPSTWVERHGIPELYTVDDNPIWGDVLSDRLHTAVDQVCGPGRWGRFGCGWWMITFPNQSMPPWEAAGKWHVDGAAYQHHIDSKESGLLAIFLFSDIAPGEGGTALSAGSHHEIARMLAQHEPRGLKGGEVSFRARKFPRRRVVEVNGKAGDVMLVHPFVLHARSKNLGQKGVDSVRIMANPNIGLHRRMDLDRANEGDYSPVERAIVQALSRDHE